jgi:putative nucleotidyltransferase with HDIG domain
MGLTLTPPPPTKRLLFVDDEPQVLEALRRTFRDPAFEVVTLPDATQGLAALATGPFDVVCADFRMPGMSGAEFLALVREQAPESYRILLSGFEAFDDVREAVNRGGISRWVTKPWRPEELVGIVHEACEAAGRRRADRERFLRLEAELEVLAGTQHELELRVLERTSNLLEALISVLAYRDTETKWHSSRVAGYSRCIAVALGIGGRELLDIEHGALLHDIGKIGTPDAILLKPGALTPEEWAVMKRHPEIGSQMLRNIPVLEHARDVVMQHHERFDGAGYPQGLEGAEIVLGARIFSIADTLDAITSDRPYRKARSYEVAAEEIRRCAGSQFDPELVRAFLSIPPERMVAIQQRVERLARLDAEHLARESILLGDIVHG